MWPSGRSCLLLLAGFPSERLRDHLHAREVVHLSTSPHMHEGRRDHRHLPVCG